MMADTVFPPQPRMLRLLALVMLAVTLPLSAGTSKTNKKNQKPAEPSPLDRYIQDAMRNAPASSGPVSAPGSTWTPASRLLDLASDVRARQVDDMVTVLVAEAVSADVTGVTKTARLDPSRRTVDQSRQRVHRHIARRRRQHVSPDQLYDCPGGTGDAGAAEWKPGG